MFGKNHVYQQKSFADAPEKSLLVTSLFYTIQGEGPFAGRPALFLRLARCNLTCSFCDTYFDTGDWMTYEEIFARAGTLMRNYPRSARADDALLVVTGGEPMLQPNLSEFMRQAFYYYAMEVQIESNGIHCLDLPPETTLVVSPKCNAHGKYIEPPPEVLKRADALKFVVSRTEPGYTHIPEFAFEWRRGVNHRFVPRQIYISPMTVYTRKPMELSAQGDLVGRSANEAISAWEPGLLDPVACASNYSYAAELVMQFGAHLSIQMHLFASIA